MNTVSRPTSGVVEEKYSVSSRALSSAQLQELLVESARLCQVELAHVEPLQGFQRAVYSCAVRGSSQAHRRFAAHLELSVQ